MPFFIGVDKCEFEKVDVVVHGQGNPGKAHDAIENICGAEKLGESDELLILFDPIGINICSYMEGNTGPQDARNFDCTKDDHYTGNENWQTLKEKRSDPNRVDAKDIHAMSLIIREKQTQMKILVSLL